MRCKTKKKKKKKREEKRKKKKIREKISYYININRSKQKKARRDSLLYRLFPFDSMDL